MKGETTETDSKRGNKEAILTAARWIIDNHRITRTDDPDILNVTVPNVPLPVSCRLNWDQKFHYCSCGLQAKPCPHIIACLLETGQIKTMEEAFLLKKNTFRVKLAKEEASRRKLRGSRKTPLKGYFKNPAFMQVDPPFVLKKESSSEDKEICEITANFEDPVNLRQPSLLAKWDLQTKEQRTPKFLLKFVQRMKQNEIFTIADSESFGKLSFVCSSENKMFVFTTVKPTNELILYGADLLRHSSNRVTVVVVTTNS